MIGTRLNLILLVYLSAAVLGCDKKESQSSQELKREVKVAGVMAGNLWCKSGSYNSDTIELVAYAGLGKINAYYVKKKPDPRQPQGYRLVAFRKGPDDKVDYPYLLGAAFPDKDSQKTATPYRLDIRPALRKDWQETRLMPLIPEEILRSQPALELVLRSTSSFYKNTLVYHPCGNAGTSFYEFLNREESIANAHLLTLTENRGLNAREAANTDRLLELEWPLHELALTQDYLSNKRLCTITPNYRGGIDVVVHLLEPDGNIRIATINWENGKGKVTTVNGKDVNVASTVRARWEFKNSSLRMYAKNAQPWDAIGSRAIWNVRGFQDGSGRALLAAKGESYPDTVHQVFQDCERFRSTLTGTITFGTLNLTGDNTKDALELTTGSENFYQDLAVSRRN